MVIKPRIAFAMALAFGTVLSTGAAVRAQEGMPPDLEPEVTAKEGDRAKGLQRQIFKEIQTLQEEARTQEARYRTLGQRVRQADEQVAAAQGVYQKVSSAYGDGSPQAAEARGAIDQAQQGRFASIYQRQRTLYVLNIIRKSIDDRRTILRREELSSR